MTHYPLRRADRALADADALAVLDAAPFVTLATVDDDGAPYAVPVSFVRSDRTLYLHAANAGGHKFDDFRRDARVCASAVMNGEPVFRDGDFTTGYASATAFGRIREVTDGVEFRRALVDLCLKYVPDAKHEIGGAMEREAASTSVWAIDIAELTGKANPAAS